MKNEFAIVEQWLPFEIHPDTPGKGVLWRDFFPGMNPEAFFRQLDARGRKMGVRFGPQPLMSNSREALEGGEFAKDHGRFDAYHEAVFRAFFTECRDIGDRTVLLDIAAGVGLDAKGLEAALEDGKYRRNLIETTLLARECRIGSAPTFVVEGYGNITGAQPIEVFREALRQSEGNLRKIADSQLQCNAQLEDKT